LEKLVKDFKEKKQASGENEVPKQEENPERRLSSPAAVSDEKVVDGKEPSTPTPIEAPEAKTTEATIESTEETKETKETEVATTEPKL